MNRPSNLHSHIMACILANSRHLLDKAPTHCWARPCVHQAAPFIGGLTILSDLDHSDTLDSKSSYEEECRKNTIKIPGTLKVHEIVREVILFWFKLTFFDTSANIRNKMKQKTYTSTKVTIRKTRKKNN